MDDTVETVKKAVQASKEILPTVSQYPLVVALLVVIGVATGIIWVIGRNQRAMAKQQTKLLRVVDRLTTVQEEMRKSTDMIPRLMTCTAVIADRVGIGRKSWDHDPPREEKPKDVSDDDSDPGKEAS